MHKICFTISFISCPKISKITNLLKNTNIGIAFKTTRTWKKWNIQNYLQDLPQRVYRAESRNLKSRFREHTRYIKNSDPRSAYALHILNCRHEYGNIDDTMTLLNQINTTTLLFAYEQMYIQSFRHNNKLIPEQHLSEHNPMFDLLHSNTTCHNPPDA